MRRTFVRDGSRFRRGWLNTAPLLLSLVACTKGSEGGASTADKPTPPSPSGVQAAPTSPASAAASSSAATAPAAAPAPASDKPSAPRGGSEVVANWEAAYRAAIGIRPAATPPAPPKPPYPACANVDARAYLSKKFSAAVAAATSRYDAAKREYAEVRAAEELRDGALTRSMNAAMASGSFIDGSPARELVKPQAAGATSPVRGTDLGGGSEGAAFRTELAKHSEARSSFTCSVMTAMRTVQPPDARLRAAGRTTPMREVDLLACELGNGLRVLIEAPVAAARATVTAQGDSAVIDRWAVRAPAYLEPSLAAHLEASKGKVADSLKNVTIEVHGVSHLQRFDHGSPAYEALKKKGMPMRPAIPVAEWSNLWVASFEHACEDEGLGCKENDGLEAPLVKCATKCPDLTPPAGVATEAAKGIAAAPSTGEGRAIDCTKVPRGEEPTRGRWEDAALTVDPMLCKNVPGPLGKGFFARAVQNAKTLRSFPAPGAAAAFETLTFENAPIVEAWRAEVAKRGGIEPFSCTVVELGQEVNPPDWPVLTAALKASGEKTEEASMYNVVCTGDEKSHLGNILLMIPSYDAWAVVDGTTVKSYSAQRHGHFAPDMRGKMLEVGIGTTLKIQSVGRLARIPEFTIAFGERRSGPVWVASLAKFQCPHEGLGCDRLDGASQPMVQVEKPVACDIEGFPYP